MNGYILKTTDGVIKYIVNDKEVTEDEFVQLTSEPPKTLGISVHENVKTVERLSK